MTGVEGIGGDGVKVRLGEIFTITSGGTPNKKDVRYYENGTIPWIKTGDLKEKYVSNVVEQITELGLQNSSAKLFPNNTVLVAMYGATIGACSILPYEAATNQACAAFLPDPKVIPDYLYYFLCSRKTQFIKDGVGGAQPNISAGYLQNVEFDLPSIEEQKKVVALLDKVYDVYIKRQKQLQKLDELVKARFVEMFGLYPDNPMGWRTGVIRDVVSDVRYGSSRPAVEGGRYPYLRMNNITYGGELDLTDTKRIDVPENELAKCTVRRGDVLFNRTNSKELVGKTCVYNRDEMMVLAGFVIRVRLKDTMLPEFLSAFLNTDFSKQMLLGMCKTAIGQANINAQEMQGIGLYIPPIELQKEYVAFKAQVDKSKLTIQASLDQLETLKQSLMQKYYG